jgi:hypothetical protein
MVYLFLSPQRFWHILRLNILFVETVATLADSWGQRLLCLLSAGLLEVLLIGEI